MSNRNHPDLDQEEQDRREQELREQQKGQTAIRGQGHQSPDGSGGSGPGEDEGRPPVIINR